VKKLNLIIIFLTVLFPLLLYNNCSDSTEKQEIIAFIDNENNASVMERAIIIQDDWNSLNENIQTYPRSQLIHDIGLLEQRAGTFYRETSEVIPPKCLRSFWDKQIEAAKLFYQALSLMYRIKDDPSISQDQVNDLIFESNNIKTSAQREFEDLCEKNGIDIPWYE